MLTPEYLNSIEFNDVVILYNKLNIEITADIINRVSQMQEITSTTRMQLEILKQTNGIEVFNNALLKTSIPFVCFKISNCILVVDVISCICDTLLIISAVISIFNLLYSITTSLNSIEFRYSGVSIILLLPR